MKPELFIIAGVAMIAVSLCRPVIGWLEIRAYAAKQRRLSDALLASMGYLHRLRDAGLVVWLIATAVWLWNVG